jgi:hypothetical protein
MLFGIMNYFEMGSISSDILGPIIFLLIIGILCKEVNVTEEQIHVSFMYGLVRKVFFIKNVGFNYNSGMNTQLLIFDDLKKVKIYGGGTCNTRSLIVKLIKTKREQED